MAEGNYPDLEIDMTPYLGVRIFDMGCGDGRNLPPLLDLGSEIHAAEISSTIHYQRPIGYRKGRRLVAAQNPDEITAVLAPKFQVTSAGHHNKAYYGFRVSGYLVVV